MTREEKLPPGVYRRKDSKSLWIHYGYRGRDYRESAETNSPKKAAALREGSSSTTCAAPLPGTCAAGASRRKSLWRSEVGKQLLCFIATRSWTIKISPTQWICWKRVKTRNGNGWEGSSLQKKTISESSQPNPPQPETPASFPQSLAGTSRLHHREVSREILGRLHRGTARACKAVNYGGLTVGAGRGSRTPKGRSPADFESDGSTPEHEINE